MALDEYVGQCYTAAFDSPEFDPRDYTKFQFRDGTVPNLKLPEDADWRVLEPCLIEDVMWLPSHDQNNTVGLNSLDVFPPDWDDYFERRAEGYAKLGKRTLELISRLCREYGIREPERAEYYTSEEGFQRKLDEIAGLWRRQQESQAKMFADFSPTPTPVPSAVHTT